LELRLKFSFSDSKLIARYFIENPNENNQLSYNDETRISRKDFKQKLLGSFPNYPIYNGFKMTNLLSRLINSLDERKTDLEDAMRELDERDTG
jgi:hypothetical protein